MSVHSQSILVSDLGGTNARFALYTPDGTLEEVRQYQCAEFKGFEDVMRRYLQDIPGVVKRACIAVACPVTSDEVYLTNNQWRFSISDIQAKFDLSTLDVINDFTAVAYGVPELTPSQLVQIGGGESDRSKPISICGPGTGLGVAHLIPHEHDWISVPCEGGHVDFAPQDEEERQVLNVLSRQFDHVSVERVLSGMGIENIYQALCEKQGEVPKLAHAAQITDAALSASCDIAVKSLGVFCRTLGAFAGNLALTNGSHGGVYIAGGIVPRFIEFVKASEMRLQFENKGRLRSYVESIPLFVITESRLGLIGAAAYSEKNSRKIK